MTATVPAPEPAPRQYFTRHGQRIGYLTAGDPANPPVILIHGWRSHAEVWRQTIDLLQDTYYCVAVDLPGLSVSDKPAPGSPGGDYTVPGLAQAVLALVDHLHIERFTVIGHSLGGQMATYIAAVLAPQRVTTLISVAGVVTGRLSWWVENFTHLQSLLAIPVPALYRATLWLTRRFPAFGRFQFRPWFYDMRDPAYPRWALDRVLALLPATHRTAVAIGRGIRTCDLTPYLHQVQARTLVIFGAQDGTVPSAQAALMQRIPGAQVTLFDPCGHFPMYELPAEYLALLREFLRLPALNAASQAETGPEAVPVTEAAAPAATPAASAGAS